ncbi:MAG: inorganic pyrophosphatase [Candidatus Parcubacteria bacterium]|jgi:inorganic pyrophosphatase
MNLWHDVPLGERAPDEFNIIVEIPKGSHNKYEIDKETGLIKLDRVNYSSAAYPCEYGFAPQTLWDDGDALDVILFATNPIPPGILVAVRPVGLMQMVDGGENDDKVLVVPAEDIRYDTIQDLKDLNEHTLKELKHFFEQNKKLKKKPVEITVPGFKGRTDAVAAIKRSIELYRAKYT